MLNDIGKFLVRSRTTTDIIAREEYETAIMTALEVVAQLKLKLANRDDAIAQLETELALEDRNIPTLGARINQLEAEKRAQAQTIKAAHIRTAEVSTRYNDCQGQLEEQMEEQIKRENEADCY